MALQRVNKIYIGKTVEGAFNDSNSTGANYLRLITDNGLVFIPQQEFRTDQGRNGSEHASAICNTYWQPSGVVINTDVDFDAAGRLILRALGGSITNTTTVALLAGKHAASMTSSDTLPSFNAITVNDDTDFSFRFAGMTVQSFQMSRTGVDVVKLQANLIGSGKHWNPHGVTSLPSAPAFACGRPFAYLSYDNGDPVNLAGGCDLKAWSVGLDNAINVPADRCDSDTSQDAGDPTASGGASDAAYNSRITHGDRVATAEFTILMDELDQWNDLVAKTQLTNVTFGARGVDLDPGGTPATTYEFVKIIIPTAYFTAAENVEVDGKAGVRYTLLPTSSGSSVMSAEVQNSIIGTFA